MTNDPASEKNNIFYAHAVYQPKLVREKVTSSRNNQSSFAVVTHSFIEPTLQNFSQLIIKNNSELSVKIKEFVETTLPWLNEPTAPEPEPQPIEIDF